MARRTAAETQRAYRRRQRDGRACFRVEVDHDRVLLALLESGRLSDSEALRRSSVERELSAILTEWSERWLRR